MQGQDYTTTEYLPLPKRKSQQETRNKKDESGSKQQKLIDDQNVTKHMRQWDPSCAAMRDSQQAMVR